MRSALMLFVACMFSACVNTSRMDKTLAYAQVHTELAVNYFDVGQVGIAVREAELALSAAPSYAPAHNLLALMYAQLRQNDKADVHFNQALAGASNTTDVRNNYAWFLCGSGRADEAMVQFAKVLRDPLYVSMDKALVNAGVCAARMGRFDLAHSYLNAALDVNPKNAVAYLYRAHMAVSEKRFDAAREDARAAEILQDKSKLLWLNVRLAQAQKQLSEESRLIAALLLDAPTSDEAAWARAGDFNQF
ncbi:type IV pilus biogenesis/stability protein PilW [Hydromonas duriensis]|uniref:Type IV pilus assembly protein PilF n=1 Tax=Hydromonas duriensis TaxID=1527608 RepID=A0A4R6Y832_9BURK|nr:type IV pilus biogenesis/stability protein PilW [Hydromonas duriensis]TDR31502.1 type IV pilus assembly protein PilF [Hydromonas duriensis]